MEGKGSKYMRFEHFINKMHELYLAEQKENQKRKERDMNLLIASTLGNEPFMDTLKVFTDNLERGFQGGEQVASIMTTLGRVADIRAKYFLKFGDYSYIQTINSFRFKILLEEIEHGLTPEVFFAPLHMARVLQGMAMLQFKNTSSLLKFIDKIRANIDPKLKQQTEAKLAAAALDEKLMDSVKGGKLKGRSPGYYLYEGFQTNQQFNDLLNILMEWKVQKKNETFIKTPTTRDLSAEENEEFELIKGSLEQLSTVVVDSKRIQSELLSSLNELKSQYFRIIDRVDRQQFLLENPYIFYQILNVQDLLVKAGVLKAQNLYHAQEYFQNFDIRMRKSAEAFYELTGALLPEAMSPQLDDFYNAVLQNTDKPHLLQILRQQTQIPLKQQHNDFTLLTLGRCLGAITQIARCEKLDLSRQPNKGQFALLPKGMQSNLLEHLGIKERLELDQDKDKFAPEYTSFWKTMQTEFESLIPHIEQMLEEQNPDLLAAMFITYSFSNAGVGSTQFFQKLDSLLKQVQNQEILIEDRESVEQWSKGVYGVCISPEISKHKELIARVGRAIWNYHQQDPESGMSLSSALRTAWALSAAQAYDEPGFIGLVRFINGFPIGVPQSEVSAQELMLFKDIAMALEAKHPKFMSEEASTEFLRAAYNNPKKQSLIEKAPIDPLHDRAVRGITNGLANAGHFSEEKSKLMEGLKAHQSGLIGAKFQLDKGYAPDIICGYKGNKVGIFILGDQNCMKTTLKPNGIMQHRFKLLEQLDPQLKCAYIPLRAICTLDLDNMDFRFNSDFNLFAFLDEVESKEVKLNEALPFFREVVSHLKEGKIETLAEPEQGYLMKSIYNVLKAKEACDTLYDSEMRTHALSKLKLELLKLALLHKSLSLDKQKALDSLLPGQKNLCQFLKAIANSMKIEAPLVDLSSELQGLGSEWMGVRMGVELPPVTENLKKDISKELMNYGNMLVQDYFKYPDWKQKMEECYDKLNLMIKPPLKEPFLYSNNHRRVPTGLFPDTAAIMKHHPQPLFSSYPVEKKNPPTNIQSDFLKDPFQFMLAQDRSVARKSVSEQVKMITSLLNLRNTLKKNFTDDEIIEKILNFEFIEGIMREHLKMMDGAQPQIQTSRELPRDPKMYARFCSDMQTVVNSENDAFSDYFIKEAGRKEYQHILASRLKDKQDVKDSKVVQHLENYYLRLQTLDKDLYHVSHVRQGATDVNYNLTSLFSNINRRLLYEDYYTSGSQKMSDAQYLELSRRVAQTKIIKARILWKLHHTQVRNLSNVEKNYLKKWVESIQKGGQSTDFNQIELTMLAPSKTGLKLADLGSSDMKVLSGLNQVQLGEESLHEFSLNELCLELSHFINPATLKKVELEILGDTLKEEWSLPKDFQICDSRNYEVDLIIQELEEKNWREAGRFDQDDYEGVRRMTSIDRGNGDIDRVFLPMDQKSLKEFMLEQCNEYQLRWLNRKENDIKTRLRVPPRKYQKSDKELYELSKIEKSYEQQLSRVFQKKYDEIEGNELHQMVVGLCDRLSLFNYTYPQEVIDLLQALWRHPKLFEEDRDRLNIYSDYFELQWKNSEKQLLCMSPLFLEGSRTTKVQDLGRTEERLRKAGVDFVENLKEQMTSQ